MGLWFRFGHCSWLLLDSWGHASLWPGWSHLGTSAVAPPGGDRPGGGVSAQVSGGVGRPPRVLACQPSTRYSDIGLQGSGWVTAGGCRLGLRLKAGGGGVCGQNAGGGPGALSPPCASSFLSAVDVACSCLTCGPRHRHEVVSQPRGSGGQSVLGGPGIGGRASAFGGGAEGSRGEEGCGSTSLTLSLQGLARTWAGAASWSPLEARTSCWTAGCTWASTMT